MTTPTDPPHADRELVLPLADSARMKELLAPHGYRNAASVIIDLESKVDELTRTVDALRLTLDALTSEMGAVQAEIGLNPDGRASVRDEIAALKEQQ